MSRAPGTPIAAAHSQSVESCWRTPQWLVKRIRDAFGGRIELDPCTTPDNPVGALMFYTPAEDGLQRPWLGLDAFVNPPFIEAKKWSRKSLAEADRSGQRIVFVAPAAIGTAWLHDLWEAADDALWLRTRLRFEDANGKLTGSPTRGTVLFGLNFSLGALSDLGTRASVDAKLRGAA